MPKYTYPSTNNQTPDPGLGGDPVTSPSNTGHGISGVSAGAFGPGFDSASCRWGGFPGYINNTIRLTLNVTHSSQGGLTGAGASNGFTLSYSLNGGSSWTDFVSRSNFTSSLNATATVDLPPSQNPSLIRVRDSAFASVGDVEAEAASVSFSVSDIQIEIIPVDQIIAT